MSEPVGIETALVEKLEISVKYVPESIALERTAEPVIALVSIVGKLTNETTAIDSELVEQIIAENSRIAVGIEKPDLFKNKNNLAPA